MGSLPRPPGFPGPVLGPGAVWVPVREDPSLPWVSLGFTVVQRAFLGLPWVSPVCGAVAAQAGRLQLGRGL